MSTENVSKLEPENTNIYQDKNKNEIKECEHN